MKANALRDAYAKVMSLGTRGGTGGPPLAMRWSSQGQLMRYRRLASSLTLPAGSIATIFSVWVAVILIRVRL